MRERVDQKIDVEGVAGDAKGGAVLVVAGEPIYLDGLACWPDGLAGATVRASGTLRERKVLPDPVNERGELVQGASGTQWVLESPVWERVPQR